MSCKRQIKYFCVDSGVCMQDSTQRRIIIRFCPDWPLLVHISVNFTRAQPDWAYEFPDRTGPDTQICRTGPAGPDWIRTCIFKHFTYQVWVINSHKIRSLDIHLVSKVNKKNLKNFFFLFLKVLKVRRPERKTSGFRTVRILKICRTSGPDMMSGRALNFTEMKI